MDAAMPTKYTASVLRRPIFSAIGGTARQPRIVPIERRPVATDAILPASIGVMPAFVASWITAEGSYTAPAHKPIIATVSSAAATSVLFARVPLRIAARGGLLCVADTPAFFHLSDSFTRVNTMIDATTGTTPVKNIARQPKCAPTV